MADTSRPNGLEHLAEIERRVARAERVAGLFDARFQIPGTRIRFGWDSILGLIPGAGDALAALPSAYMMVEAVRIGARKRAIARMGLNAAIDLVVGGVPLLGDAFDLFFKGHQRNARILRLEAIRLGATPPALTEGPPHPAEGRAA